MFFFDMTKLFLQISGLKHCAAGMRTVLYVNTYTLLCHGAIDLDDLAGDIRREV